MDYSILLGPSHEALCSATSQKQRPTGVAEQLTDIFPLLGAPAIPQSDNSTEFTATSSRKLKIVGLLWLWFMANHVSGRANGGKKSGEPGENVAVPITLVDRGRGDPRNIPGVIVNRDLETDIYKIAVKAGVLNGGFSRNQFDLCPQSCLLKIKTEKMSVSISLCLCGQRSQRSRHQESKGLENVTAVVPKKCQTKRCKCFI